MTKKELKKMQDENPIICVPSCRHYKKTGRTRKCKNEEAICPHERKSPESRREY